MFGNSEIEVTIQTFGCVCVAQLLFLQQCTTARERELNRASLSSVLINKLDGSHSSLDVLVAHDD